MKKQDRLTQTQIKILQLLCRNGKATATAIYDHLYGDLEGKPVIKNVHVQIHHIRRKSAREFHIQSTGAGFVNGEYWISGEGGLDAARKFLAEQSA